MLFTATFMLPWGENVAVSWCIRCGVEGVNGKRRRRTSCNACNACIGIPYSGYLCRKQQNKRKKVEV